MILGVHVSIAGSIREAPARAHELGCNTMQIFSRSPQEWRKSSLLSEDIRVFKERCVRFKIDPVFVHMPYLVNLASPVRGLREDSTRAYIEDVEECRQLNVRYLVTHMGSHKETSERSGLKRFIQSLDRIAIATKGSGVRLLLENTAGSGSWLGYTFSHITEILSGVKEPERLGVCLDTCHAFAAGYDIATAAGLKEMLEQAHKAFGLTKIQLIHLNDAKDGLRSHRDRHEHIGRGLIGPAGMKRIIKHPALKKIPFILETPKQNAHDDMLNLAVVKGLAR